MAIVSKDTLISVLPWILRPVASLCLRHTVKLIDIVEALKATLVQVAVEEIKKRNEPVSTSKISAITGVHRKDVSSILKHGKGIRAGKDLMARIIGAWQQSKRFCSSDFKPKLLSFEGKDSEFSKLVLSVSADLNPYTVLYELERSSAVQRTPQGLKLVSGVYVPKGDVNEGFRMLARDTRDLLDAVEENIFGELSTPNLHIGTEFDRIPVKYAPGIRAWLYKNGSKFHKRVQNYLAKFDADINPELKHDDNFIRISYASFSRSEPTSLIKEEKCEL